MPYIFYSLSCVFFLFWEVRPPLQHYKFTVDVSSGLTPSHHTLSRYSWRQEWYKDGNIVWKLNYLYEVVYPLFRFTSFCLIPGSLRLILGIPIYCFCFWLSLFTTVCRDFLRSITLIICVYYFVDINDTISCVFNTNF